VLVPLVHLGAIRATGEDASAFLHNLFSNDVKKLGPNEAQFTSFNRPRAACSPASCCGGRPVITC
jgi:folate-binding Fe-S cluster repair protein YgfZ